MQVVDVFRQRDGDLSEQLVAEWNARTGQIHFTVLVDVHHVVGQVDASGDSSLHAQLPIQVVHEQLVEERLALIGFRLVEFLLPQAVEGLDELPVVKRACEAPVAIVQLRERAALCEGVTDFVNGPPARCWPDRETHLPGALPLHWQGCYANGLRDIDVAVDHPVDLLLGEEERSSLPLVEPEPLVAPVRELVEHDRWVEGIDVGVVQVIPLGVRAE